jgi:hypothetical protein
MAWADIGPSRWDFLLKTTCQNIRRVNSIRSIKKLCATMEAFEQLWDFCATMDAIIPPSQRDSPMSAQATGLGVGQPKYAKPQRGGPNKT